MLRDEEENILMLGKIIFNGRMYIYIPSDDLDYFKIGERVEVVSLSGVSITRKIQIMNGSSKYKKITISKQDYDLFKTDEQVRVYPLKDGKRQSDPSVFR